MLFGIVLVDSFPFRLELSTQFKPGTGQVIISAPLADNAIEEIINHGIAFAERIAELEEVPFPNLSDHDLTIRLRTPGSDSPICGRSYGLLLCLGLALAAQRRCPNVSAAVTGGVDEDGKVLDVGCIGLKRKAAAEFGMQRLILPAAQLDFFSQEIIQIPVTSIYEAYTAVTYGKAER